MKGFFKPKQTRVEGRGLTCIQCGLYKNCETPKMRVQGKGKKKIMLIAEAPSQKDDKVGEYWQDKTGRFFKRELKALGIDINEDCYTIHALGCFAGKKK